jgi:hypothetical protein
MINFELPYRLVALSGQPEAFTGWQFIFKRTI